MPTESHNLYSCTTPYTHSLSHLTNRIDQSAPIPIIQAAVNMLCPHPSTRMGLPPPRLMRVQVFMMTLSFLFLCIIAGCLFVCESGPDASLKLSDVDQHLEAMDFHDLSGSQSSERSLLSGGMQISVRDPSGEPKSVEVSADANVGGLEAAAVEAKIFGGAQILVYQGTPLMREEKPLSGLGIKSGTEVNVVTLPTNITGRRPLGDSPDLTFAVRNHGRIIVANHDGHVFTVHDPATFWEKYYGAKEAPHTFEAWARVDQVGGDILYEFTGIF